MIVGRCCKWVRPAPPPCHERRQRSPVRLERAVHLGTAGSGPNSQQAARSMKQGYRRCDRHLGGGPKGRSRGNRGGPAPLQRPEGVTIAKIVEANGLASRTRCAALPWEAADRGLSLLRGLVDGRVARCPRPRPATLDLGLEVAEAVAAALAAARTALTRASSSPRSRPPGRTPARSTSRLLRVGRQIIESVRRHPDLRGVALA